MRRKSDSQVLEEELLAPSRRGGYGDEEEFDSEGASPRRRTGKEMGQHFKSDLEKGFRMLDEAYKIPDKICKGIDSFCKSFGKSFGNSGSSKKRRGRR